MCAGAKGLLGMIAQNQFEEQHGEETVAKFEQLFRKIKEADINPAGSNKASSDSRGQAGQMGLAQIQQVLTRQVEQAQSDEKSSFDHRKEILRIATLAEKNSGWPEGLLQKAALDASEKLEQKIAQGIQKKDKKVRPKKR